MVPGVKKRVGGDIGRILAAYVVATAIRRALVTAEGERQSSHQHHVDILAGYAGAANITKLGWEYDLTALAPCDKDYGWDLLKGQGQKVWWKTMTSSRPLVLILGHPCTLHTFYNVCINYKDRPEALEARREAEKPLWDLTLDFVVFNARLEEQLSWRTW